MIDPAPNQSEDCLMKFLLQAFFPLSEYDSIIIRYFYKYSVKSIVILSLGELLYNDNYPFELIDKLIKLMYTKSWFSQYIFFRNNTSP